MNNKEIQDLITAIREFAARLKSRSDSSMGMSINEVINMLKDELEEYGFEDILEPKIP